jgi:hypothetical protein
MTEYEINQRIINIIFDIIELHEVSEGNQERYHTIVDFAKEAINDLIKDSQHVIQLPGAE